MTDPFQVLDLKTKKAVVYALFEEVERNIFKCKQCEQRIRQNTGKGHTSLQSHFTSKHKNDIQNYIESVRSGAPMGLCFGCLCSGDGFDGGLFFVFLSGCCLARGRVTLVSKNGGACPV